MLGRFGEGMERRKGMTETFQNPRDCAGFEPLLSECASGGAGLSAAERQAVLGHLAVCGHCRKVLAAWQEAAKRLAKAFPPAPQLTADDVPDEVVLGARLRVEGKLAALAAGMQRMPGAESRGRTRASGTCCGSQPTAGSQRVPRRSGWGWPAWACALAACALLIVGGLGLWLDSGESRQPGQQAAQVHAPQTRGIVQMRQEFDKLVERNNARQIGVAEFEKAVSGLIAESQALLAQACLPEANAIHAQKLVADGYGALAEYQNEFTAYLAFAERLGKYYAERPGEFKGKVSEGLTAGHEASASALLSKVDCYRGAGQLLQAVAYYEEVAHRFAGANLTPYAIMRLAQTYAAYDLPEQAAAYEQAMLKEHAQTKWALALLRKKAEEFEKQDRPELAADVYLDMSRIPMSETEKDAALLSAGGLLVRAKKYQEAERLAASLLAERTGPEVKRQVHAFLDYARKQEFAAISPDIVLQ